MNNGEIKAFEEKKIHGEKKMTIFVSEGKKSYVQTLQLLTGHFPTISM